MPRKPRSARSGAEGGTQSKGAQDDPGGQRAERLPEDQRVVGRGAQGPRREDHEGEGERADDGDEDRGREAALAGLERHDDADEAEEDRAPAPRADVFAEQPGREGGDIDRRGEPVGHHVGQRQRADGEIEAEDLEGRGGHARDLELRSLDGKEFRAGEPHERNEDDERRRAAQEKDLADAVGGDEPFAERVVEREEQDAEKRDEDAETLRGRIVKRVHRCRLPGFMRPSGSSEDLRRESIMSAGPCRRA